MEQTKVYIVEAGLYLEDTYQLGIYTDKALAELLAEGVQYGHVYEQTVDDHADKLSADQRPWAITLKVKQKTGLLKRVECYDDEVRAWAFQKGLPYIQDNWGDLPDDGFGVTSWTVNLWAASIEDAEAQARELLTAYLAQQKAEA